MRLKPGANSGESCGWEVRRMWRRRKSKREGESAAMASKAWNSTARAMGRERPTSLAREEKEGPARWARAGRGESRDTQMWRGRWGAAAETTPGERSRMPSQRERCRGWAVSRETPALSSFLRYAGGVAAREPESVVASSRKTRERSSAEEADADWMREGCLRLLMSRMLTRVEAKGLQRRGWCRDRKSTRLN